MFLLLFILLLPLVWIFERSSPFFNVFWVTVWSPVFLLSVLSCEYVTAGLCVACHPIAICIAYSFLFNALVIVLTYHISEFASTAVWLLNQHRILYFE